MIFFNLRFSFLFIFTASIVQIENEANLMQTDEIEDDSKYFTNTYEFIYMILNEIFNLYY